MKKENPKRREKKNRYKRKWYRKNRDKVYGYIKKWRENNREQYNKYLRNYRREKRREKKLIKAARAGNIDKIKKLIEAGVNLNVEDNWGNTALMWASKYGYKKIINFLKQHGAEK